MGNSVFGADPYAIWLRYDGREASQGLISFYDVSRAMLALERSLALTTHFVLNNEIVTQTTSLRGARILSAVPEKGSYKIPAYIMSASVGLYSLGSLEADNPLGHLVFSLYELVVYEAIGQRIDYEESLRELYQKAKNEGSEGLILPKKSQINSLVEKVEPAIADLHRPMMRSETADELDLFDLRQRPLAGETLTLNSETYLGLRQRLQSDDVSYVFGHISSFNMNTFNGRIFSIIEQRPIPFTLAPAGRSPEGVELIGKSLARNIQDRGSLEALLRLDVIIETTRTGRVSRYIVVKVSEADETQRAQYSDDDFDVIDDG